MNPVTIGSSINAYTQLGNKRKRISVNEDLGAVLFVHRANPAIPNLTGDIIVFDYSINEGYTWTNNVISVLSQNIDSAGARFPQGYIYNPTNNTNISNARVIASAAYPTNINNSWGGIKVGSAKLDGSSNKETILTSTNGYIPSAFTERIPGEYWMIDELSADGNVKLYKGVYSVSADSLIWTSQNLVNVNSFFDTTVDGNAHFYDFCIAFSPDASVGFIAVNADVASANTDTITYPVFWKSVDGGNSWSSPEVVNLNNLPVIQQIFGNKKVTTAFESSLVVDKFQEPHFVFVAGEAGSIPYSIITGITLPIIDITYNYDHWEAIKVDTVQSFRGRISGTNLYQENSPNVSRSSDGSFILYSWVDTRIENQAIPGINDFPDFIIKGYFVDSDVLYYKVNVSEGSEIEAICFLPQVANIILPNSSGYSIHSIITSFSSDENSVVDFIYLHGVDYWFESVNNKRNYLFSISKNYPNPFSDKTSIDINLKKSSEVKITVSNLLGQIISSDVKSLYAGQHTLNIDANNLISGIYIYTVNVDGYEVSDKMIVRH